MALRVDLFCEDAAHEACGRALVARCAAEEAVDVTIRVPTASFGIPRLKRELRAFQDVVQRSAGSPDVLAVLVDANRDGAAARRREIDQALDQAVFPCVVVGVPEPYVERWLLADPPSFATIFGREPAVGGDQARVRWKERLIEALERNGEIVTQGGAEFAQEIIETMDLYAAGRAVPSLGAFVGDLRAALRRLGRA